MGKRSPILGYNHNVRYRGLVFHVQTEDSGVATPHLFTHLFHHGVIVSTRKLVYDAGSAEEAIKSLMQAQHKAVLKDLRRGHFDDKIDSYLGGTPGLLARDAEEPPDRPSEAELAPSSGAVEELATGAPTDQMAPITEQVMPVPDEPSVPVMIVEKTPARKVTPPPVPPGRARPALPFSVRINSPSTPPIGDITLKTEPPAFDSSPEIEIQLEVDDNDVAAPARLRGTRDTDVSARDAARTEAAGAERAATISDSAPIPPRASTPTMAPANTPARGSNINAATLPAPRPISRPPARPALTPPQVVSRPLPPDGDRNRRESEAVEVYSPALPSAELPPAGNTYSQLKKTSRPIPLEGLKDVPVGPAAGSPAATASRDTSAPPTGVPRPATVPAGLSPPRRAAGPSPSPVVAKPTVQLPPGASPVIPRSGHTEPLPRNHTSRLVSSGAAPRGATQAGSGVVMTRPSMIVGGSSKTTGTIPRIRKAREDEGRGFGQGLISEKSLDEVILAYLSEDADEK